MAPTQPKKPVGGAYGVFLAENREKFTKACAGQKASFISKMAGEEWGKLTAEAKKPFDKKYLDNKAKYEKDLKAFLDAGGVVEKGARGKRKEKLAGKKKKDPNAPKKPAGGGYGQYLAANRAEIKKMLPADHKMTDVTKKAGEVWKKLTAEEKKPYEQKYTTLQAEYKKAMEQYKKDNPPAEEEEEEDEEDEDEEEDDDDDDEEDEDYEEKPKAKAKAKGKAKAKPAAAKPAAKKAKK